MYKRNYLLWINVMEEIVEIKSCVEILVNDIKIDTTISICSTVNREL